MSKIKNFLPHPDKVFVTDLERGARKTKGGIILRDDDMKDHGIRPRWGRIFMVGKNVTDVKEGEWVLVQHGRWSFGIDLDFEDDRGVVRVWHIDFPEAVLVVSEEDPREVFTDIEIPVQ